MEEKIKEKHIQAHQNTAALRKNKLLIASNPKKTKTHYQRNIRLKEVFSAEIIKA